MNCRDFERRVGDLARKQLMDEEVSRKALIHAQSCTSCGGQLAEERLLFAQLRLLAVSMEREIAPAELETTLLSVYRQKIPSDTRSLSTFLRAAAATIVFSAISLQLLLVLLPSTLPTDTLEPPVRPMEQAENSDALQEKTLSVSTPVETPPSSPSRVASDFILLVPCSVPDCLDGGQVMRVTMPRPALNFLGLPINEQFFQEPVTADVLIGEDGVVRAIRFAR
jgi:hypothetical protein